MIRTLDVEKCVEVQSCQVRRYTPTHCMVLLKIMVEMVVVVGEKVDEELNERVED